MIELEKTHLAVSLIPHQKRSSSTCRIEKVLLLLYFIKILEKVNFHSFKKLSKKEQAFPKKNTTMKEKESTLIGTSLIECRVSDRRKGVRNYFANLVCSYVKKLSQTAKSRNTITVCVKCSNEEKTSFYTGPLRSFGSITIGDKGVREKIGLTNCK